MLVTALALSAMFATYLVLERNSHPDSSVSKTTDQLRQVIFAPLPDHRKRFKTYILTTTCARESPHLTEWMMEGTFMLDTSPEVAAACKKYPSWDYKQVPLPKTHKELGQEPKQKYRAPQTDEERKQLEKDPDFKIRTPEFQQWMEQVEPKYRNKYAQTLRACSQGSHELCILLEDDIVFINEAKVTLQRLGMHTLAKYSGPEVSWDCAKKGSGWEAVGIDGNKSQCRIVHRDKAGCLADYFDTSNVPADIALAEGMKHCNMVQKKFLLVQHTGRKSIMGHDQ